MKERISYILREGLRSRLDYLNSFSDPQKDKIAEYRKDLTAVNKWHKENKVKFDLDNYIYTERDYSL